MRKKSYPVHAFAGGLQNGMLLRDHFAFTALKAVYGRHYDEPPEKISRRAYELADAMMAERDAANAKKPLRR